MHTIKGGGDACGQKMCEPMEKTMDRFSNDCVGNRCVSGIAAAGMYVSCGRSAYLRRRLPAL